MKKILIIEDEETIRNELKTLLENSGYEVLMLEKFTNAKEDIKSMTLDLILLDINLPNINGEMLLKEIRKESNIPVIMVTSRVCEVDEVLSMSYGADDYITKPYNPTILLLRIQNIFKRMENNRDDLFYDDIVVNPKKGILEKNGKVLELTKNEMIIFSYLLNNKENMTYLWNNEEYINDNALTVNISRLRIKLSNFDYENITKKETIFCGTTLNRDEDNIHIKIYLEKVLGEINIKMNLNEEEKILTKDIGLYEFDFNVKSGSNYFVIDTNDFTGNVDILIN